MQLAVSALQSTSIHCNLLQSPLLCTTDLRSLLHNLRTVIHCIAMYTAHRPEKFNGAIRTLCKTDLKMLVCTVHWTLQSTLLTTDVRNSMCNQRKSDQLTGHTALQSTTDYNPFHFLCDQMQMLVINTLLCDHICTKCMLHTHVAQSESCNSCICICRYMQVSVTLVRRYMQTSPGAGGQSAQSWLTCSGLTFSYSFLLILHLDHQYWPSILILNLDP